MGGVKEVSQCGRKECDWGVGVAFSVCVCRCRQTGTERHTPEKERVERESRERESRERVEREKDGDILWSSSSGYILRLGFRQMAMFVARPTKALLPLSWSSQHTVNYLYPSIYTTYCQPVIYMFNKSE